MPILLWSSLARFVWRIRRKRIAEQGGIVAKVCHNTNQPNYSPHCPGTMWNWNVKKKYISYITILIDYHWDKTLQELSSLLLLWWSWRWRNKIPNHWLVLNIFNQFCVVLACYVPFWPACSSLFCALKSSVFYILCLLQKKTLLENIPCSVATLCLLITLIKWPKQRIAVQLQLVWTSESTTDWLRWGMRCVKLGRWKCALWPGG